MRSTPSTEIASTARSTSTNASSARPAVGVRSASSATHDATSVGTGASAATARRARTSRSAHQVAETRKITMETNVVTPAVCPTVQCPCVRHPVTSTPADPVELTPQQWNEVVAPPAQLAARCGALMPHDGVLSVEELEQLASDIAADEEIWEPLTIVDPHRRRYRLLYEDDRIDVWVLSWMSGQGTGFHDHDLSGVGLACARGEVVEKQMVLPTGASAVRMTPGVSRPGPPGYIHSVAHCEGTPAVTIHAYSPPLVRVGQYRVDDEGIMRRSIEHGRQELLDNTIAAIDPERA
jgi:hypothetical protein